MCGGEKQRQWKSKRAKGELEEKRTDSWRQPPAEKGKWRVKLGKHRYFDSENEK